MDYNQSTAKGLTVYVKYDNVEQALRKFKKKVMDSGILQEIRSRGAYEKPTVERKRKKAAAKQRWKKKLQNQTLPAKLY